jgi:hypothetical protein
MKKLFVILSTLLPLLFSIFVFRDNPSAPLGVTVFACTPFAFVSYIGYRLSSKIVINNLRGE